MLNHRNQDGSGRNQGGRWRWMRPVWVLYKKLEGHILGFPDSNPFDPRSTVTIHTTHHTTKTYTTNKIRILPRHTVCVGVRRVSLAKDKINPEIPSSSRPGAQGMESGQQASRPRDRHVQGKPQTTILKTISNLTANSARKDKSTLAKEGGA